MKKESIKLSIPNPHSKSISLQLLKLILKQAGVEEKQWMDMK